MIPERLCSVCFGGLKLTKKPSPELGGWYPPEAEDSSSWDRMVTLETRLVNRSLLSLSVLYTCRQTADIYLVHLRAPRHHPAAAPGRLLSTPHAGKASDNTWGKIHLPGQGAHQECAQKMTCSTWCDEPWMSGCFPEAMNLPAGVWLHTRSKGNRLQRRKCSQTSPKTTCKLGHDTTQGCRNGRQIQRKNISQLPKPRAAGQSQQPDWLALGQMIQAWWWHWGHT